MQSGTDKNVTTKEHFEIFKNEVKAQLRAFGLLDWEVYIRHEDNLADSLAECEGSVTGKMAVIRLAVSWGVDEITEYKLKKCAYHEVCELMLMELGQVWQWFMGSECERRQLVSKCKHDIIRRLENRYFEES